MGHYFRQDWLETPDGARIYFDVRGAGGPAIVLCDGLGCDGFAWKYLIQDFQDEHTLVHLHWRGHGRSTVPTDPTRVGMLQCCDDISIAKIA